MLIPEFKIQQEDSYIIISIRVPYIKVTAAEFYIEEGSFKFYLKPYLLCLSFEQPLKEAEEPFKASYNYDKHILTVYLEKKNPKEFFENLNLLSNVLNNKKSSEKEEENKKMKKKNKVLVEVIDEKGSKVVYEQKEEELKKEAHCNQYGYGFCGNYNNVFKNLEEELNELFFFDPVTVPLNERYEFDKKITEEEFDENSYMYDKLSNFEEIERIVESTQALSLLKKELSPQGPSQELHSKLLESLPAKELLLSGPSVTSTIYKQLFSIAFSYIYELICMEGELSQTESVRTINKTSAVFSSNIPYSDQSLSDVVYSCCRRCVTYSLYRHLDICQKVLSILKELLSRDLFVYILCQIKFMFDMEEPRYLLNTIYINDYLTWLTAKRETSTKKTKAASPEEIEEEIKENLSKHIEKITLTEEGFDLDIPNEEMGSMMMTDNDSQYVGDGEGSGDGFGDQEQQNTKESQDLENMLDLD